MEDIKKEKKVSNTNDKNIKEKNDDCQKDNAKKHIKEKINYKTKYLEVLAEMENLRKRFDDERIGMIKFRAASFIQELLPTLDMFEMALSSKDISDEVKNWLIGFEMILNKFNSSLKEEGVEEIKIKLGDEFDSSYHQSIGETETKKFKPGEIVEIKSKGYLLHGRLLRPANVIIEKDIKKGDKNE